MIRLFFLVALAAFVAQKAADASYFIHWKSAEYRWHMAYTSQDIPAAMMALKDEYCYRRRAGTWFWEPTANCRDIYAIRQIASLENKFGALERTP